MNSTAKQQPSSAPTTVQGSRKAIYSHSNSMLSTSTPQGSRPHAFVPSAAPTAPPPTPTDYEIMTESCDWCLAETPWDDGDLFGNIENVEEAPVAATQTTPPSKQAPPQVNLQPRQALGIPMM